MTIEDFSPKGPISVSQWDAAVADLLRRTQTGKLAWTRIQFSEAVRPVYQAQTGERRVQLSARLGANPADFLIGTVWGDAASGSSVLKVYDADRELILTSPALEALDGLKSPIEAQIRRSAGGFSGG